ncbi:prolyl oligopeptidase family serine peptidase [Devosia oryziradicis]|uniref:Prolyl oligopeptidase family serine peptidase n=1 Tax=Devosia oryziradicis TaxID=2801335 RepID=A0ABX7C1S0_9HYPH|nr:alpha/beta hydrolase-fold protein [Devosia oryziradicis]QQR37214.1 prolyl oligopeptidase family serine peptidase [Devosia oryziradicis]
MPTSVADLHFRTFYSAATRSDVEYAVLAPTAFSGHRSLPLVMHLHGAMSSAKSLEMARGAYEDAWAAGDLPLSIVVCASTPTLSGFYIDHPGGPSWETLVAEELPAYLATKYPLSGLRAATGFSMGGYGALKITLRRPDAFCAVSALCPTIFSEERAADVPERNRRSVLNDLNEAMANAGYEVNSVPCLLRAGAEALKKTKTQLFIDCGENDEFMLHDGAVSLHRLMRELGVSHSFRSVPEAAHATHIDHRQRAAVSFIAEALRERERSASPA